MTAPRYPTFRDFLSEIEGFSCRAECLIQDFDHLSVEDLQRVVEWIRAAFEAGRLEAK